MAIEIAKIVCAESYLFGKIVDCSDCGGSGEIKKGKTSECYSCGGSGKDMGFKDEIGKYAWKDTLKSFSEAKKTGLWKQVMIQFLRISHLSWCLCRVSGFDRRNPCSTLERWAARFITNANAAIPRLSFAGIRSAGGTGQALSVLIADILRRDFDLKNPLMTFEEVERYKRNGCVCKRITTPSV